MNNTDVLAALFMALSRYRILDADHALVVAYTDLLYEVQHGNEWTQFRARQEALAALDVERLLEAA